MDAEQGRSEEQEREFDRLGDAGQERSDGDGEEKGTCDLFFLGFGAGVHRQSSAGKAAHHERIFTGKEAAGVRGEVSGVRIGELGEEDVLRAFDHVAVDHHGSADTGLPEGQVEDVVQAEGNERALHHAVEEGAGVTGLLDKGAEREDARLDHRPDEVHAAARDDGGGHGGDRDKAGAAEERESVGQLDLITTVGQDSAHKTGEDAAEDTHLHGRDAEHRGVCALTDVIGESHGTVD